MGGDSIGDGRYVLAAALGEGTFGQVRLGHEVRTGEAVAVKVLERARIADADSRARLHNEIEILRKIEHASLLRLLEVIDEPDATYLVTEHVSGGELFAYIDKVGHLPETEAAELFAQMLSAVDSLHALGIVHRDLKPENMLLELRQHGDSSGGGGGGPTREIKIIDFGLGALLPSADEVLTSACGSPHYAAPEMLIGDGYTGRRADLWSLGVCLYATLCGCLPFDEDDMEVLYDKIIDGDFSFDGCPVLSAAAIALIKGLLTTDPEKRLTASQALQHEWLIESRRGAAARVPAVLAGSMTDLARARVLRALADEFSLSKDAVVGALARRDRTYETALYFLVRQREINTGRVLDQPRFLPTPPPPRPGANGRRPVPRRLREARTAFAARAGAPRPPPLRSELPARVKAGGGEPDGAIRAHGGVDDVVERGCAQSGAHAAAPLEMPAAGACARCAPEGPTARAAGGSSSGGAMESRPGVLSDTCAGGNEGAEAMGSGDALEASRTAHDRARHAAAAVDALTVHAAPVADAPVVSGGRPRGDADVRAAEPRPRAGGRRPSWGSAAAAALDRGAKAKGGSPSSKATGGNSGKPSASLASNVIRRLWQR